MPEFPRSGEVRGRVKRLGGGLRISGKIRRRQIRSGRVALIKILQNRRDDRRDSEDIASL